MEMGGSGYTEGGSCRILPSVTSNPSGSLAVLPVILMLPDDLWYHVLVSAEQSFPIAARRASIEKFYSFDEVIPPGDII